MNHKIKDNTKEITDTFDWQGNLPVSAGAHASKPYAQIIRRLALYDLPVN